MLIIDLPQELAALRDGLIECLALVTRTLTERSHPRGRISTPTAGSSTPATTALAKPAHTLSLPDELRSALGLLLKHRGGPGFGHGRLDGTELDALTVRLRSVAGRLLDEARARTVSH
jgi:hypothetical protein